MRHIRRPELLASPGSESPLEFYSFIQHPWVPGPMRSPQGAGGAGWWRCEIHIDTSHPTSKVRHSPATVMQDGETRICERLGPEPVSGVALWITSEEGPCGKRI